MKTKHMNDLESAGRLTWLLAMGAGLALMSFACPLAYVGLFSLLACAMVPVGTIAILSQMDGLSGAIWGPSIIRGAAELMLAILRGLIAVSGGY